ncbi:hypothetical protein BJV74DRAFT_883063 [Russula compacta]|nr:hypothetical protein BJV74DRAFT_883063 [Russula compacta]
MALQRFVTWASLGNKRSKRNKQRHRVSLRHGTGPSSPKGGRQNGKPPKASDPLVCRDTLDVDSADVSRLISTPVSNSRDMSARKEGTPTGRSRSVLLAHPVEPGHDATSSEACADLANSPSTSNALEKQSSGGPPRLKRSKSIFHILSKSFRRRATVPLDLTPHKSVSVPRTQENVRRMTHRPQAVPIALSNDVVSKERRDDALRARGLLPQRQPRDLSAVEADADRQIDALQKIDTLFPGFDNGQSDAKDIALSWRTSNARWLSHDPSNSDTFLDSMDQVASPIDMLTHSWGSSELLIGGAVILRLQSHSLSLKAASSKGSVGHEDSRSQRAPSLSPASPDGRSMFSSSLEDLPSETPARSISEDVKTHFAQSVPSSPAPSKTSHSPASQFVENPLASARTLRSQRSASSSRDLQPLGSPRDYRPPSKLRTESGSQSPSVQLSSELPDFPGQAQLSSPDPSPLYLLPIITDSLLASPTTPTLSASMYCSSETSDSPGAIDHGELVSSSISYIKGRRADVAPFAVKNGEGGLLCQEIIMEGSEPILDEDDFDPFASPSFPTSPTGQDLTACPTRRASRTSSFLRPKHRASTLGPPSSAAITKSASMLGLRRTLSNAMFGRPRAHSTVSYLGPVPRPPSISSLGIKIHDHSTISAEASQIDDDEVRRLSELAFMA